MPESPSYAVRKGRGTSASGRSTAPVGSVSSGTSPRGEATSNTGSAGARRRSRNTARTGAKDGARHGRSAVRMTAAETVPRRRLVRLAVTPAGAVALTAAAAMGYVLSAQGSASGIGGDVWLVLGAALLLCAAAVTGGMFLATAEARATVERYTALRRSTARHQAELQSLLQRLEQGERPRRSAHGPLPEAAPDDAFALLTREVTAAARVAEAAILESAALARSNSSGSEEKVEVFVNLSRRLQSLVHREIELLDELENQVEDPDLLKGLFHVDHLATRIRRHAENLAVLGGAVSRRQWTRPVTMTEVLRSAIAEVEQYPRVKLVPPIEGNLRGNAVADVIHLLAELIENASVFSAPQTQVLLRAQHVTAGLAVEVEDRGLGMTASEQNRMNALLSDPEHVNVQDLLQDGRIGLFVVSQLARRHGIVVQLQSNIYGGIQAVLILPRAVLGEDPLESGRQSGGEQKKEHPADPQGVRAAADSAPSLRREGVRLAPHLAQLTAHPPIPAQQQNESSPTAPGSRPAPAGSAYGQAVPAGPEPVRVADPDGLPAQNPGAGASTFPGPDPRMAQRPASSGPVAEATGPLPGADPQGALSPAYQLSGDVSAPSAAEPGGDRPRLPRRRRQQHLVPELRTPPPPSRRTTDDFDAHDPGLMAAFRRGTSLADTPEGADTLGGGVRLSGPDEGGRP